MHQQLDRDPAIEEILNRHQITRLYRHNFYQLADGGLITDDTFALRLEYCINYKAAREEIMELLSRPSPSDSSVPTFFESLDRNDFPPFGVAL